MCMNNTQMLLATIIIIYIIHIVHTLYYLSSNILRFHLTKILCNNLFSLQQNEKGQNLYNTTCVTSNIQNAICELKMNSLRVSMVDLKKKYA